MESKIALVSVLVNFFSLFFFFFGGWGGGGWGRWKSGRRVPLLGQCGEGAAMNLRVYLAKQTTSRHIVQELCESRGGRPVLSVLTSLLVSVDVKIYCTMLRHWSQLVPNMSHDI